MKFILHIGQSKTGTTTLQRFLAENRPHLQAQGVCYPDFTKGDKALSLDNHNVYAEALAGLSRYPWMTAAQYTAQLAAIRDSGQYDAILLSGESFWGAPQIWRLQEGQDLKAVYRQKLEGLRDLVVGHEVQVVLYLRPQDTWFDSALGQIIRYERILGPKDIYQSDEQVFDLLQPYLDYAQWVDLWREIIQPDQFDIIPFTPDELAGGDIVTDFLQRLGIADNRLVANVIKTEENVGWDHSLVELKKEINKKPRSKTMERMTITYLDEMNARITHRQKYKVSSDLSARIKSFCEQKNKALPVSLVLKSSAQDVVPFDNARMDKLRQEYKAQIFSLRSVYLYLKLGLGASLRSKMPELYAWIKGIKTSMKTMKANNNG